MTEKILIMNQRKNTLEIQDEDDPLSCSYMGKVHTLKKSEENMEWKGEFLKFLTGKSSQVLLRTSKK